MTEATICGCATTQERVKSTEDKLESPAMSVDNIGIAIVGTIVAPKLTMIAATICAETATTTEESHLVEMWRLFQKFNKCNMSRLFRMS